MSSAATAATRVSTSRPYAPHSFMARVYGHNCPVCRTIGVVRPLPAALVACLAASTGRADPPLETGTAHEIVRGPVDQPARGAQSALVTVDVWLSFGHHESIHTARAVDRLL